MQAQVGETLVRFVNIEGVGGFPVDNIAHWRTDKRYADNGTEEILLVFFRAGGFIEIPGMTPDEFGTFVFGTNPPF